MKHGWRTWAAALALSAMALPMAVSAQDQKSAMTLDFGLGPEYRAGQIYSTASLAAGASDRKSSVGSCWALTPFRLAIMMPIMDRRRRCAH